MKVEGILTLKRREVIKEKLSALSVSKSHGRNRVFSGYGELAHKPAGKTRSNF